MLESADLYYSKNVCKQNHCYYKSALFIWMEKSYSIIESLGLEKTPTIIWSKEYFLKKTFSFQMFFIVNRG